MDKINEYLKGHHRENGNTKRIKCADGFSVSVQASYLHYCTPRKNKAQPYSEVELGYPSRLDELIGDYAEDHRSTKTVYGYVPIEIVNRLINKHGGIANE